MNKSEKIKLDIPIIVEGKYDIIKLKSIIDGQIIKTDGFSVFKSDENKEYIRQLADKNGIIVLTDSDGAGLVIRNYLNSILPKEKIIHLYPPQIKGKEKRKVTSSKEGYLGVEGIDIDVLRSLFSPFEKNNVCDDTKRKVTKLDLFDDGLIGGQNSAEKRLWLKQYLNLPSNISTNALIDTINFLYSYEEYKAILEKRIKQND
ncbi:MAG: DUF4093 domain-containing protein [Ruminococcaceae bacterium]|nr:DUF4093 domain-containing protein [Oscillospiraceae bacterium]